MSAGIEDNLLLSSSLVADIGIRLRVVYIGREIPVRYQSFPDELRDMRGIQMKPSKPKPVARWNCGEAGSSFTQP